MTDPMLEESFEVAVTKAKLKEDERHLKDVLEKFKQQVKREEERRGEERREEKRRGR